MSAPFKLSIAALLILAVAGCSSSERAEKSEATAKPEMTLRVASINAAALNKRLEKKDIAAFVRILKREQIEIVALQNVVRYPGLESRIDAVNEISSQADMRSAFGEMSDNAGRQMGNAVLSTYPIHSNANTSFDGIKSATFEAALHAVIDGGVKEILVFAATLPPKASTEDQAACIRRIGASNPVATPYPMIIAGNLPAGESVRKATGFDDVQAQFATLKNASTRVWYSGSAFRPLSAKTVETDFGTMTIVQFGIFRQPAS